jgi:hypothetical protein
MDESRERVIEMMAAISASLHLTSKVKTVATRAVRRMICLLGRGRGRPLSFLSPIGQFVGDRCILLARQRIEE